MKRTAQSLLLLLCSVVSICSARSDEAPAKSPQNTGFEKGELGKTPTNWHFPDECAKDGYTLKWSDEKPFAGKRCAVLQRTSNDFAQAFGNVMQVIDATDYRGKRVRFKAAVRTDVKGDGNQAMLWFRVDCPKENDGFFDNMSDRPIKAKDWKHYEIVGDIAKDATLINFGLVLLGNGTAAIDDVSLELVDESVKPTRVKKTPPGPGLMEVRMAATLYWIEAKTKQATFLYPLPLSYRDQVPLTFQLSVEPADCAKSVEIVEGPGPNRVLKLTLASLGKTEIKVAYQSVVLVSPSQFDKLPRSAKFPQSWPDEAKPWLASTWCCEHDHEKVGKVAKTIREESKDVIEVIRNTLSTSQRIFSKAKGNLNNLTAVEALDKQGSCTSCANLVAALLRGAGVPARVLAGYPTWSGPLQTHYIVEAYVPNFGWLPVESTMGKMSWENYQQVNVSIVPVEHESQAKAKQRGNNAGAVPYLTLSELEDPSVAIVSVGTLGKFCDHECRMIRRMDSNDDAWAKSMNWAKPRWAAWLNSKPALMQGKVTFGPVADQIPSTSLPELMTHLK